MSTGPFTEIPLIDLGPYFAGATPTGSGSRARSTAPASASASS